MVDGLSYYNESKFERMRYEINIDATAEVVWEILWNEPTMTEWLRIFDEATTVISDWNENSKIQFLNGSNSGIYGKIFSKIPNKQMIFKHDGLVIDGVESVDEESQKWGGAFEGYILEENNAQTKLTTYVDIILEYKDYFDLKFPQALNLIKTMCENK